MPQDRAAIERFQSLATLPYRTTYGAALMRLTAPGQAEPVTAILFGDATLTPSQAAAGRVFTLKTVGSNPVCQATPPGLAVRVPSGKTGRITINGVEINLGSTTYVAALSSTETVVANLQGNVGVRLPTLDATLALPVGQQTLVTTQDGVATAFTQPAPSPYAKSSLLQWLVAKGLPQVGNPNGQPDGRIACGGPIAFGQTISQANATPGQECIYQFCANAGDVATITMERLSGRLDPYIDLRAPDKSVIKWNDDTAPGASNATLCNQVLPVSGCDYTIVARPSGNDTSGKFRVTLAGQSVCQAQVPNCQVNPPGVILRNGPGTQYAKLATLAGGTKLFRLSSDPGTPWVQVQVATSGQKGWVLADAEQLYCDDGVAVAQPSQGSSPSAGPPAATTVPPPPPPSPTTPPKAGPFPLP